MQKFLLLFLPLLFPFCILAQTVQVGQGSYSLTLPSGAVGPQFASGAVAVPKISPSFQKPVQTCDYWSSLIYPFYGDAHSNNLYAHPLNFRAKGNGLQLGYTTTPVFAAQDYLFPFSQQLTVGVVGLSATKTVTDDYGDWTVTAFWNDGTRTLKATLGHGLPFAYFTISGGNANISASATPNIWYNQRGVIGMTVEGRHYGVFGPDSSVWSGSSTLTSSLNGKNYFSVGLLPDNTTQTLELYRKHAYAFVTNSVAEWTYNETTAKLLSTFSYTTELKEARNGNINSTLTALYRHQWKNTQASLTGYEYISVAGKMKVFEGNSFTTELTFEGVLPSLPDEGIYNRDELSGLIDSITTETIPSTGTNKGTYRNGKLMARFAHLVHISDQLGKTAARDYFLSQIKTRLQDWFTVGGAQSYVYNSTWKTLTGYPSEFGADNQINDHPFHSGYAIMAAATVAMYDSLWAKPENWGGMVDLLIRDGNNYERNDSRFPFLRAFDAYSGHSWAAGHGDFGDGNNEESSSESMNFAAAVILWGQVTHQKTVRDLGICLYTTERSAIEQYWFDIDNEVFPASYPYKALGMVWGGKGVHSTWFGANPDFIHGINMLPFTGGSLYLGRNPEYVKDNYREAMNELQGTPPTWKDILWQYIALADPGTALSAFFADPNYLPEEGETKAHTYHWIGNLKRLGRIDISVTADIPTYAVFKTASGTKTYIAYNARHDTIPVHFSDGFILRVPPRKIGSFNNSNTNINAPVVILATDKTLGKIPLRVQFSGSRSFDRNGLPLSYYWNFGDGNTATKADTLYTYSTPGSYTAVLTVTNQQNLFSSDSVLITVNGNGTPYSGTPFPIPGTIQAENYDRGGEGIAYHDIDANNIGLAYRPTEGVDLEGANDGGFDVFWMVSGEWLEYTIQVPATAQYDIIANMATVPGFGYFRILVDNTDVTGKRFVTNTGGWQSWRAHTISNIPLTAGRQILRFEVDTDVNSERRNWLYSLNSIQVRNALSSADNTSNLPSAFEIGQNFPNPFNAETSLHYSLPFDAQVIIRITNTLGEELYSLTKDQVPAGKHTHSFYASVLASGTYFYSVLATGLTTPNSRYAVKKMIVLK